MRINRSLLDILELPLIWMDMTGFYLRAIDRIERSNTEFKRRTTPTVDVAGEHACHMFFCGLNSQSGHFWREVEYLQCCGLHDEDGDFFEGRRRYGHVTVIYFESFSGIGGIDVGIHVDILDPDITKNVWVEGKIWINIRI